MGTHLLENLDLPYDFSGELAYLKEEVELIESRLARQVRGFKKEVEQLMTIRGVGFYSALTILAWIGDVNRFPDHRRLSSWAGMVPRVRQTSSPD
jgi:transposase